METVTRGGIASSSGWSTPLETFPERSLSRLPAGRQLLPEGDFRDWADIDAWAEDIAVHLR